MLTDSQVRSARSTGRPHKLFDGGGLYLNVIANCGYKKGVAAGLLRSNNGSPEQKKIVEYMRQVLACGRSKAESERREFIGQIVIQSDDGATSDEHDPSYVRKVLGVRELIRDKQIRTEGVATVVLNGREFNDEGWSFPASAIEKLEASQTWWMNLDEDTDWAHFTVYVRNTTDKALSALVFQLSDAECKTGRGRGPLFALQLVEPMRPLEDRAIRFSSLAAAQHKRRRRDLWVGLDSPIQIIHI